MGRTALRAAFRLFVGMKQVLSKLTERNKDEAERTDNLVTTINDGTTRPDENIIPVVDRDVVADCALDMTAIDGAEDRGFARVSGDKRDGDSRLGTHGEDLRR